MPTYRAALFFDARHRAIWLTSSLHVLFTQRPLERPFPFPPAMLKTMGTITGKSVEIYRFVGSLCVDNGKIRKVLGWKPLYTVEDGIRETVFLN